MNSHPSYKRYSDLQHNFIVVNQSHMLQSNQASRVQITTNEFAVKFRSKTEVYAFMSIDVGAYLPPNGSVTIYFLKDLVMG